MGLHGTRNDRPLSWRGADESSALSGAPIRRASGRHVNTVPARTPSLTGSDRDSGSPGVPSPALAIIELAAPDPARHDPVDRDHVGGGGHAASVTRPARITR